MGFTEAEVKKLGPRFLIAMDAAVAKVPSHDFSVSTVVLIRNANMGNDESGAPLNPLDQEWDETLRSDFTKIHPLAKLLVIRLVFPDQ
ncbi:MAG: hypothetical protein IPK97_17290 [Ahniella sp.]|nr:hypothetical protein [Ahniella sp.]